jgi:hypothetical protein
MYQRFEHSAAVLWCAAVFEAPGTAADPVVISGDIRRPYAWPPPDCSNRSKSYAISGPPTTTVTIFTAFLSHRSELDHHFDRLTLVHRAVAIGNSVDGPDTIESVKSGWGCECHSPMQVDDQLHPTLPRTARLNFVFGF